MAGDDEDHDHDDDSCWTQGPAAPMAASILANDPSCQGILALTLRDALSQIQKEQQSSSNEQDELLLTGGTCNIGMDDVSIQNILQAMGNAVAHTQQEHWKLQQQQQQQQQQEKEIDAFSSGTTTISRTSNGSNSGKLSALRLPAAVVQPPAALVRGRLDQYNRQNGKWRIVMDKVTFRRRMSLDRSVRRKSEKPSLWQVSRERFQPPPPPTLSSPLSPAANAAAAAIGTDTAAKQDNDNKKMPPPLAHQPSGLTLQILAYNDLE